MKGFKIPKLIASVFVSALIGYSVSASAAPFPEEVWTTGVCAFGDVTDSTGSADDCLGLLWEGQNDDIQNISTNTSSLTFINSVDVSGLGVDGLVDTVDDTTISTDGFFDGGWSFLDKQDGGGASTIAYDAGAGTWSFSGNSLSIDDEDVMVLLKQSTQTSVYLFSGGLEVSGDMDLSVFDPVGLSHFSIYTRGGTTVVPEPGALILLSLGLLGLRVVRKANKA